MPLLCRIEPFSRSASRSRRFQLLLSVLYVRESSGFNMQRGLSESNVSGAVPSAALTYGELTTHGFLSMLDRLPARHRLTNGSVLFDLGSGVGKFSMGAAMMTPVRASVGIEIVEWRHSIAQRVKARAAELELLTAGELSRLSFRLGDALDPAQFASSATHVYTANLCFSDSMNKRLVAALEHVEAQFECIMVLVQLPLDPLATVCLLLHKTAVVQMTWSSATVYYYCRCSMHSTEAREPSVSHIAGTAAAVGSASRSL